MTPDAPVLLITGASSGIGAATARAAVADGRRVVLAARREPELAALAAELGGAESALAIPCDVRELEQLEAAVEAAQTRFGRLDAVFANAGNNNACCRALFRLFVFLGGRVDRDYHPT